MLLHGLVNCSMEKPAVKQSYRKCFRKGLLYMDIYQPNIIFCDIDNFCNNLDNYCQNDRLSVQPKSNGRPS